MKSRVRENEIPDHPRAMSLAEASECCGQYRWGTALDHHHAEFDAHCTNCPLLIERRERVLRAGRAM